MVSRLIGNGTIGPASRSVGLAPSTQISRGFHDARMTRLTRNPSDDAQGKGRQLCRFVGGSRPYPLMRRFDVSMGAATKMSRGAGCGTLRRDVEISLGPKSGNG
jgi:hypothetical protein